MHAAGAAGAVVAIADCSSSGTPGTTVFYGAACVDGSCVTITDAGATDAGATDAGADAYDANGAVFYGAPCLDGSCLPSEDAGGDAQPEASQDASANGGDAGSADAPTDSSGGG
jgi:hypothetical protein